LVQEGESRRKEVLVVGEARNGTNIPPGKSNTMDFQIKTTM
jgi:hypothetical protein